MKGILTRASGRRQRVTYTDHPTLPDVRQLSAIEDVRPPIDWVLWLQVAGIVVAAAALVALGLWW